VPLDQQRRDLWNAAQIEEGLALVTKTQGRYPIGPYQLQAAIAAIYDEAATADATRRWAGHPPWALTANPARCH
jgi:predicted RNA polymerase sigma factor